MSGGGQAVQAGGFGQVGLHGPSPEVCPWLDKVMSRKYSVSRPGMQWQTCPLIPILEGWQGVLGEGGGALTKNPRTSPKIPLATL